MVIVLAMTLLGGSFSAYGKTTTRQIDDSIDWVSLHVGRVPIISESDLQEDLEEAKRRREELASQKKKVEKETKELQSNFDKIDKYLQEIDEKQSLMMLEVEAIESELARLNSELAVTNAELEAATVRADKQYENMKRRFQYLYEHGNMTELEILLGSRSISDILNYDEFAGDIRAYDYQLTQSYYEAKHQVNLVKEKLEMQIGMLEDSRALYDAEFEYVETLIAKKTEALAEYERQIGVNEEVLEDYSDLLAKADADVAAAKKKIEEEEERKRREAAKKAAEEAKKRAEEAARLAALGRKQTQAERDKKYANVPHTGVSSADSIQLKNVTDPAKMIWPLPGDSYTGSGFGPRRAPTKGASTFHKGVDIGGKMGAPIVAALAGTVRFSGYSSGGGGYLVEIDHGNGFMTRYLHCSKLLVSTGDKVLQGQKIALVGSTGISTGPHLHFSVLIDGTNVDPLLYVRY